MRYRASVQLIAVCEIEVVADCPGAALDKALQNIPEQENIEALGGVMPKEVIQNVLVVSVEDENGAVRFDENGNALPHN